MKEAFTFLTALAILAIAQTLATALGIVLLILAFMGVVAFPRQTFGLIASLGLLALALREPAVCAAALGAVAIVVAITSRLAHRTPCQITSPVLLAHAKIRPNSDQSDDG